MEARYQRNKRSRGSISKEKDEVHEASKRNRMSQFDLIESREVLKLGCQELKSMKQLRSIDDAFYLSLDQISKITAGFLSERSVTTEEYMKWDLYAKAFYLKAHSSCGNRSPLSIIQSLQEEPYMGHESSDELEHTKFVDLKDYTAESQWTDRPAIFGPFKFGFYSEETAPCCIPYHLYLLIKEAVDIMDSNPDDVTKLEIVERKICFFCHYFYSHLPVGWIYERHNARNVVDSYDTERVPKYNMTGYTPFSSLTGGFRALEFECGSKLSRYDMTTVMGIIHSRETPKIWELHPWIIQFYCKVCSCFGIDYHRLEEASEVDVCLMKVELRPTPLT